MKKYVLLAFMGLMMIAAPAAMAQSVCTFSGSGQSCVDGTGNVTRETHYPYTNPYAASVPGYGYGSGYSGYQTAGAYGITPSNLSVETVQGANGQVSTMSTQQIGTTMTSSAGVGPNGQPYFHSCTPTACN